MRIIHTVKKPALEVVQRVTCEECECEFEVNIKEDEEYYVLDENGQIAYFICPQCGEKVYNEERQVTSDNIQYPLDFFKYDSTEGAKTFTDKEIQDTIRELCKKAECAEVGYFFYKGSGDAFVVAFNHKDEIYVVVAKNYEDANIFKD